MSADPRKATEHDLHRFTVDLLRIAAHPLVIWAHVPNGELRDIRVAKKLKAMGVRPGFPDFIFVLPDMVQGSARVAFLELKSHNGRLSPAQTEFERSCQDIGAPYFVARSSAEVEKILHSLGVVLRFSGRVRQCRDGVAAERAKFTEGGTSGLQRSEDDEPSPLRVFRPGPDRGGQWRQGEVNGFYPSALFIWRNFYRQR